LSSFLDVNILHSVDLIDSLHRLLFFTSSWPFFWHVYSTSALQEGSHLLTIADFTEKFLLVLVQYCQSLCAKLP